MQVKHERTPKTTRMDGNVHYQARVAALMSRKSLGEWLELAILEKLAREFPQLLRELEGKDQGASQQSSRMGNP